MSKDFIMVTQDDIDLRVAENIKSRELELVSYDFERKNHEAAIVKLGNIQWDEKTLKYRNMGRDQMIVAAMTDGLDSATIQTIVNLIALDYHKLNLEAVKGEVSKSERHYDNLLATLPAGPRRTAAIAAHKAKEAAKAVIK